MKVCAACGTGYAADADACASCGWAPERIQGFSCHAPALALSGSGFPVDHFDKLAALEAGNFWFRSRNRLIRRMLRRWFANAESVLEIGCGTGFVLDAIAQELPGARVLGSELQVAGLHYAAGRVPRACLLQMDARQIPFRDEFDLVAAFDVVEHIREDEAVIDEMHAALRPGGGVLISVPQHMALWSAQDEAAHHVRRYARGELERKLQARGFRIVYSTSFVALLFPVLLAARRMKREHGEEYDDTAEFRIPRLLNALLEGIMTVESWLLALGIRFPFGGSRLVVACKEAA